MELINAEQASFSQLLFEKFDIIIAVSGYESRCTHLINNISLNCCKRIAFAFEENIKALSRPQNDKSFSESEFEFYNASGNSYDDIIKILEKICPGDNCKGFRMLIDYSCMTKVWYSAVINYFLRNDLFENDVEIWFSYTPSAYSRSKKSRPGQLIEPIPGSGSNIVDNKQTSLIIGLGYEKNRAEQIINEINPDVIYAFYSDPPFDPRYLEEILKNNKNLLGRLEEGHIIKYPVGSLETSDSLLTSLCLDLRLEYKVILAPIGPKPFALSCLLLAARYPDIEVWRVRPGENSTLYDRKPSGQPVVCRARFCKEEEEKEYYYYS